MAGSDGAAVLRRRAAEDLPKLLTLQDRDPLSPTYGCFDRQYWLYRKVDFPTAMAQEFVLPLAFAWAQPKTLGGPFAQDPAVREWIIAGLRFAAQSAARDGGGDDFFPGESALGACAFALYAGMRAADVIGLRDAEIERYFIKRGRWVAQRKESGRLSNHEALVAVCCLALAERTRDPFFELAFIDRRDRLLSWASPEGWFPEYDGCDLGYLTLTLGFLAEMALTRPNPRIDAAVDAALPVVDAFLQPDGVAGGELNARNTYNFFPHAFELIGRRLSSALALNDRHIAALEAGDAACYADDQIVGHHLWSQLWAARDYVVDRPPSSDPPARMTLEAAGMTAVRRGGAALFAAPGKGGGLRLFRQGKLVATLGQLSYATDAGRDATAAQPTDCTVRYDDDGFVAEGRFGWSKRALNTPLRMIVLRALGLSLGRLSPDLLRKALQKMLIVGARPAPGRFKRVVRWEDEALIVEDEWVVEPSAPIRKAGLSMLTTPRAVVQSRVWHPSQRDGAWADMTDAVREGGTLKRMWRL